MALIPLRQILQGPVNSPIVVSQNNVQVPTGYRTVSSNFTIGTAKASDSYTPSTQDQIISSGYYLAGNQIIKGDPNLEASNIVSGVTIFGVRGTRVIDGGGIDLADTTAQASDVLSQKVFYDSTGTSRTGTIPIIESNSYVPGLYDITISAGNYLKGAQVVRGDPNLLPQNIVSGVTIFGVQGTYVGSATGETNAVLGYIVSDGLFQPLSFSGSSAVDSGQPVSKSCYQWPLPSSALIPPASVTSSGVIINSNQFLQVASGETWISTTVNSDGILQILPGGTADSTHLNGGGRIYTSSGATATNILPEAGAQVYITVAPNTYIQGSSKIIGGFSGFEMKDAYLASYSVSDGGLQILSGGSADHTHVEEAIMYVSSAGKANGTDVQYGGSLCVSSGGTATSIIQNGGAVWYDSSAYVTFVPNIFSEINVGKFSSTTIHSGTTANNISVTGAGKLYIYQSGSTNNTIVESKGDMYVYAGGIANTPIVQQRGSLVVYAGGIVNTPTVSSNGSVVIYEGAIITNPSYLDGAIIINS